MRSSTPVRPYPVQPAPVGSHDQDPRVTLPLAGSIPDLEIPDLQVRMEWAIARTVQHSLSPVQASVLKHVAYRAGPPRGECWQSQESIGLDLGCERGAVGRALRELIALGLLVGRPRFGESTVYRIGREGLISPASRKRTRTPVQKVPRAPSIVVQSTTPLNSTLNKKKRRGGISDSVTPPPLDSCSDPGKGMQGEGGGQMVPRAPIEAALDKHADAHSWRSTGAAVAHYLKNPDKFTVDLATWESEAAHAPKVNPRTGEVYSSAGQRRQQSARTFQTSTEDDRPRKRVNGYY